MIKYSTGNMVCWEQAYPDDKEEDEEAWRDYWAEMRELRRQEIEERRGKQC